MGIIGTEFCNYITPCGWCSRLEKECPERDRKLKRNCRRPAAPQGNEKLLNPAGEYAVKFAENHGISIQEAMEQPMVKARMDFFNQTGM